MVDYIKHVNWDFSIYVVSYESEQGCQGFMPKDPYYVGGIGMSPKIFNPGNYSHFKYSNWKQWQAKIGLGTRRKEKGFIWGDEHFPKVFLFFSFWVHEIA